MAAVRRHGRGGPEDDARWGEEALATLSGWRDATGAADGGDGEARRAVASGGREPSHASSVDGPTPLAPPGRLDAQAEARRATAAAALESPIGVRDDMDLPAPGAPPGPGAASATATSQLADLLNDPTVSRITFRSGKHGITRDDFPERCTAVIDGRTVQLEGEQPGTPYVDLHALGELVCVINNGVLYQSNLVVDDCFMNEAPFTCFARALSGGVLGMRDMTLMDANCAETRTSRGIITMLDAIRYMRALRPSMVPPEAADALDRTLAAVRAPGMRSVTVVDSGWVNFPAGSSWRMRNVTLACSAGVTRPLPPGLDSLPTIRYTAVDVLAVLIAVALGAAIAGVVWGGRSLLRSYRRPKTRAAEGTWAEEGERPLLGWRTGSPDPRWRGRDDCRDARLLTVDEGLFGSSSTSPSYRFSPRERSPWADSRDPSPLVAYRSSSGSRRQGSPLSPRFGEADWDGDFESRGGGWNRTFGAAARDRDKAPEAAACGQSRTFEEPACGQSRTFEGPARGQSRTFEGPARGRDGSLEKTTRGQDGSLEKTTRRQSPSLFERRASSSSSSPSPFRLNRSTRHVGRSDPFPPTSAPPRFGDLDRFRVPLPTQPRSEPVGREAIEGALGHGGELASLYAEPALAGRRPPRPPLPPFPAVPTSGPRERRTSADRASTRESSQISPEVSLRGVGAISTRSSDEQTPGSVRDADCPLGPERPHGSHVDGSDQDAPAQQPEEWEPVVARPRDDAGPAPVSNHRRPANAEEALMRSAGYEPVAILGAGHFARVYGARRIAPPHEPRAIKVLRVYDREQLHAAEREIAVVSAVRHSCCVRLLGHYAGTVRVGLRTGLGSGGPDADRAPKALEASGSVDLAARSEERGDGDEVDGGAVATSGAPDGVVDVDGARESASRPADLSTSASSHLSPGPHRGSVDLATDDFAYLEGLDEETVQVGVKGSFEGHSAILGTRQEEESATVEAGADVRPILAPTGGRRLSNEREGVCEHLRAYSESTVPYSNLPCASTDAAHLVRSSTEGYGAKRTSESRLAEAPRSDSSTSLRPLDSSSPSPESPAPLGFARNAGETRKAGSAARQPGGVVASGAPNPPTAPAAWTSGAPTSGASSVGTSISPAALSLRAASSPGSPSPFSSLTGSTTSLPGPSTPSHGQHASPQTALAPLPGSSREEVQVHLVMQYCDGGTLHDAIGAGRFRDPVSGAVRERAVLQTALEIARGLAHLHATPRRIVHRDLSTANVLLVRVRSRDRMGEEEEEEETPEDQEEEEQEAREVPGGGAASSSRARGRRPGGSVGHEAAASRDRAADAAAGDAAPAVATADASRASASPPALEGADHAVKEATWGCDPDPSSANVTTSQLSPFSAIESASSGAVSDFGTAGSDSSLLSADSRPRDSRSHVRIPAGILAPRIPDDRGFRVVLSDFGLSTALSRYATHRTSGLKGTVVCMSPELLVRDEVTPALDVYSLGILLFWMSSGVSPYGTATPAQVIFRKSQELRYAERDDEDETDEEEEADQEEAEEKEEEEEEERGGGREKEKEGEGSNAHRASRPDPVPSRRFGSRRSRRGRGDANAAYALAAPSGVSPAFVQLFRDCTRADRRKRPTAWEVAQRIRAMLDGAGEAQ